ncbi:MAG: class I SAM-dependent methyltransferase [Spirochaetales bacterium]|nr:class I SAM-dependent methyltransferase [Spirochaetales bacterium]
MPEKFLSKLLKLLPELLSLYRSSMGLPEKKLPPDRLTKNELLNVARWVRQLSGGLTENRELIGEVYMNEDEWLSAYLLYYFPISFIQSSHGIGLLGNFSSRLEKMNALDLGSGPGPCSLALWNQGVRNVLGLEKSRKAIWLAEELARRVGAPCVFQHHDALKNRPLPDRRFDLIIAGHFFNELWSKSETRIRLRIEYLNKVMKHLNKDGYLILFEPALTSTNRDTLRLRDGLLENGYTVHYPCFFQGGCPALEPENGACYTEIYCQLPGFLKAIIRAARFRKENLKYTLFIMGRREKTGINTFKDGCRVVSSLMESKSGRLRYYICGRDGRFTISAPGDLEADYMKTFLTLKRMDVISFRSVEKRKNGIGLTPESKLERL